MSRPDWIEDPTLQWIIVAVIAIIGIGVQVVLSLRSRNRKSTQSLDINGSNNNTGQINNSPGATLSINNIDPETLAKELSKHLPDQQYLAAKDDESDPVSTGHLPSTSSGLFGRDSELKRIDKAYASHACHVIGVVADGGRGKTALVKTWLQRKQKNEYDRMRVFVWSFYTQGSKEGPVTSAEMFFAGAFNFFSADKRIPLQFKGFELAKLILKRKTLLVLDGLEPLQDATTWKINDNELAIFLNELNGFKAGTGSGLCIITSRMSITNLADFEGVSYEEIKLPPLSAEAGAQILCYEDKGVKRKHKDPDKRVDQKLEQDFQAELIATSKEYDGHALALVLLRGALRTFCDADIERRKEIPLLEDPKEGDHAFRVMKAYEQWLGKEPKLRMSLCLLYFTSLFDRPTELETFKILESVHSNELMLKDLRSREGELAISTLRELDLVYPANEDDTLECHPLITEYFEERFRERDNNAWKDAHGKLFEHYKSKGNEEAKTFEDIAPFFTAIVHGCKAGLYSEALNVYRNKITRKDEFFATRTFGVFNAEVKILFYFFEEAWFKPVDKLNDSEKIVVLRCAGFDLVMLKRFDAGLVAMETALKLAQDTDDIDNATITTRNLINVYIMNGNLTKAVKIAEENMPYAFKSTDTWMPIGFKCSLADALHRLGDFDGARKYFKEAEEYQKSDKFKKTEAEKRKYSYFYLYGLPGYQFCDFLLTIGDFEQVIKRSKTINKESPDMKRPANIALNELPLARAYLAQFISGDLDDSKIGFVSEQIEKAINSLKEAGRQDKLPIAFLTRAAFARTVGGKETLENAEADLRHALELAVDSKAELQKLEVLLEQIRVNMKLQEYEPDSSIISNIMRDTKEKIRIIKNMVSKTGYHIHDNEIDEIEYKFNET
jgi:tetratricopeptide (TPR) repeat protein